LRYHSVPVDPGTTLYYYTFSTIAQTLAAAGGLLGGIAVFRLGRIRNAVEDGLALLRPYNGVAPLDETWHILQAKGYEGLMASVYGTSFGKLKDDEPSRHTLNTAQDAARTHRRVLWQLALAFAAIVLDICLCLVALPFVPWLSASCWGPLVAGITVGLAVVSLAYSAFLIGSLARPHPV
jgi:hypothetical protein